MKASATQNGLTVRAIAGTHAVLLGIDLEEGKRAGCLGFSIERVHLGTPGKLLPPEKQEHRWLPNRLRFPNAASELPGTTDQFPLQKFRWGDFTTYPGHRFRYRVIAQYGTPGHLTPGAEAEVEVTTEDPASPETTIFFNRGAAASQAYIDRFGDVAPDALPEPRRQEALDWLSRGLEEGLLAFMARAKDSNFALHAAIYEFEKPKLLAGLKEAMGRGAKVQVVYHFRRKDNDDKRAGENEAAANAAGLKEVSIGRKSPPDGAICHNKFVVLLENGQPKAVWTGSTNWTDGAIYGQWNVGHALNVPDLAQVYERYFQLLRADADIATLRRSLGDLTLVPEAPPPGPVVLPIFSPQKEDGMLSLYAALARQARCVMVCAPFNLADVIEKELKQTAPETVHFLLLDKKSNVVDLVQGDPSNRVSAAVVLNKAIHDFQRRLLFGKESFHHSGIHIHAKIIAADPFGPDPIVVTGSANFSPNSAHNNDENSLLIRGNTAVADIYASEFMRLFDHYYFRGKQKEAKEKDRPLALAEDDHWSDKFYVSGSSDARDRKYFAGT